MRIRTFSQLCAVLGVSLVLSLSGAGAAPDPVRFEGNEPRPADALVLFDGKDTSHWTTMDGKAPIPWRVSDGYMEVHGGNIRTRESFSDCQLHLEFWLPLMADAEGQARANSGVYLQGSYEIQILDSYGQPPRNNESGGIYGVAAPQVNASRPPEHWQTYDVVFRAPRFKADGSIARNARITAFHNGVLIHDSVEVPGPTTAAMEREVNRPGPVVLQDHGNPVRFRNIWIRPVR